MIEFFYAPTPNGWKVAIMLEECGLPYETVLMRLGKGDQGACHQPGGGRGRGDVAPVHDGCCDHVVLGL